MRTWTFPVGGGTPWDDLWQDQPWRDPAIEADLAQDAIRRAVEWARMLAEVAAELGRTAGYVDALFERFGPPAELAGEPGYGPVRPVPVLPPPRWLVADRRRRLNTALQDDLVSPTGGAA